ncbi:uncharacterized protein ARMOST_18252 [Armillaria ostoyae]|uniref:Uncharacterized protein n=1 Tax=Armillaria ostoyae TaxID=47428 RepID=A0A284S1A8_ARMOS|nr:uncharacterized protein ARMOST_18252 [Armillaria ostoyae]
MSGQIQSPVHVFCSYLQYRIPRRRSGEVEQGRFEHCLTCDRSLTMSKGSMQGSSDLEIVRRPEGIPLIFWSQSD